MINNKSSCKLDNIPQEIIINTTSPSSNLFDNIKDIALQIAKNYNSGIHIEIDAINNSKVYNCNICVKLKVL